MAFDITGLSEFVKGQGETLIEGIVLAGSSFSPDLGLSQVDDVKFKKVIPNIFSSEVKLQSGDPSDTVADGSTALSEISLETTQLTLHKRYSTYALDQTVYAVGKKMGSAPDDDAYLAAVSDLTAKTLVLENDKMIWQGNSAGSTGTNLDLIDGFSKLVQDASASVIKTGTAAAKFTAANAVTKVELMVSTMIDNKPELASVKTRIFLSPENFFTYYRALTKQNVAIDLNTIQVGGIREIQVPGTNVYATEIAGLAGNNNVYLGRPENFIIASDIATEASNISLDYLNEAMKWRLMAIYKLGVQIGDFSEVVAMLA